MLSGLTNRISKANTMILKHCTTHVGVEITTKCAAFTERIVNRLTTLMPVSSFDAP
jgi:hypothetical protein